MVLMNHSDVAPAAMASRIAITRYYLQSACVLAKRPALQRELVAQGGRFMSEKKDFLKGKKIER
jgi:hypothetical protein